MLDDRSTDGTAQVVAHHVDADPRVRLVDAAGEPPAAGTAKPWACQRLAEAAHGEVLVFVDADVVLEPAGDRLRTSAHRRTSGPRRGQPLPAPGGGRRARAAGPAAAAVVVADLPAPGSAERSARRPSLVAANGQLLAIRADAYDAHRGHAASRAQVLDDVALFRAVKRAGGRAVVVDGTELATCRMYDGVAAAARRLQQVAVGGVRLRRRVPPRRRAVRCCRTSCRRRRGARGVRSGPSATPPGSWAARSSLTGSVRGCGRTRWRTRRLDGVRLPRGPVVARAVGAATLHWKGRPLP